MMEIRIRKVKRDEFKEFNPPKMVLGITLENLAKLNYVARLKGYNNTNEFIEKMYNEVRDESK